SVVGPLVLGGATRIFPVSLDHLQSSPMFRHVAHRPRDLVEISNGVDVERFRPDLDGGAVRASLGIPPGAVVVGYLGAMDQADSFKGVPVLIKALARARTAGLWF